MQGEGEGGEDGVRGTWSFCLSVCVCVCQDNERLFWSLFCGRHRVHRNMGKSQGNAGDGKGDMSLLACTIPEFSAELVKAGRPCTDSTGAHRRYQSRKQTTPRRLSRRRLSRGKRPFRRLRYRRLSARIVPQDITPGRLEAAGDEEESID